MDLPATPLNRAVIAHLDGRFADAERGYRALADVDEDAAHNLAMLLRALGRLEEVEPMLRRAAAAGSVEARVDLSMTLLAQGRYAEGWPLYEARRELDAYTLPPVYRPEMEWRGEDLTGRHIAVLAEQGFGDTIMFGRFVDALATRAGQVSYVCLPPLHRLLPAAVGTPPAADVWAYAGSLPGLLGVTLETLPPPARITVAPRQGAGIGVCLQGSTTNPNDLRRSLHGAERDALLAVGRDLSPEATGAKDFHDTAEIIADLALVIAVDTATAHLAATLGKPTWILLPAYKNYWPWMRDRSDSPWYPSMRLFQQPTPGDWGSVVQAVLRALEARGS